MKRTTILLVVTAAVILPASKLLLAQQETATLKSPSGKLEMVIRAAPSGISWELNVEDKPAVAPSRLGLELQGSAPLGANLRLQGIRSGSQEENYILPHGKASAIRKRYNWLAVNFEETRGERRRLNLEARAYDDGVAFRYLVPEQPPLRALRITGETTEFHFAKDATTYPLLLQGFRTPYEDNYVKLPLSAIHRDALIALPFLAEIPGVAWLAVAEAHIENYAGMYLTRPPQGPANLLVSRLAPDPTSPGVAVTAGTPVSSPWRVVMVAQHPGRMIESTLIESLNPAPVTGDWSWVRPGKAAWTWWSGEVAEGVARSGMNTETIKHYVDFAAEAGLDFVLIDEGWSHGGRGPDADLTRAVAEVDLPEILRYSRQKQVGIWLWCHWSVLDRQMKQAFETFEKWGVRGVKIDFMDRDDQWMVDFYRRTVKEAAAHRLMVNFHGAYKPDGLRRTWPNLMTREGVLGLEYSKWSARVEPEHNVMLAYTRLISGPMDYTPGGFRSRSRERFVPQFRNPSVLGTRAHQLALFVVYESPFLCLADHPGAYRSAPEDFAFIRAVPASWDETRFISGEVREYACVARRRGGEWYVGTLNNWTPREIEIPLDFLGPGQWQAEIWSDSPEAEQDPNITVRGKTVVQAGDRIRMRLASGGGHAMRLAKVR